MDFKFQILRFIFKSQNTDFLLSFYKNTFYKKRKEKIVNRIKEGRISQIGRESKYHGWQKSLEHTIGKGIGWEKLLL